MRSHVLVNHFPYEACLVRKDILPQTLRRLQSASCAAGAQEQHPILLQESAALLACGWRFQSAREGFHTEAEMHLV